MEFKDNDDNRQNVELIIQKETIFYRVSIGCKYPIKNSPLKSKL